MTFAFAYPAVLFLLVLPALLVMWVWRRQGGEVVLPIDDAQHASGRGWKVLVNLAESLPALLLALIVVVLAGPQRMGVPRSRRALTNIEFCVDVSGSMTAVFGDGTRYDASMAAINDFLSYREGDAFGLTFFSDIAMKWVPLTNDVSAFACAPPFMNPSKRLPRGLGGGTQIAKALRECRKTLIQRETGDRMIILVSDGFSSDLNGGNDMAIAKQMMADGIVVYGVHVADGGVPDQIVNLVTTTGGEVFNPGDKTALAGVFKRIDAMQQAEMERGNAEMLDNFFPFCVSGLSVLAASALSLFGLRYTPW